MIYVIIFGKNEPYFCINYREKRIKNSESAGNDFFSIQSFFYALEPRYS